MSDEADPSDPLRLAASRGPDAPAIDAPGGVWSYAELDRTADRVASALRPRLARTRPAPPDLPDADAGGPPVIAAFLPPGPEAVAALHGIPRSGAALAPLHSDWKPPELASVLSRLRPTAFVVTRATRGAAEAALAAGGLESDPIELAAAVYAAPPTGDTDTAPGAESDASAADPDAGAIPRAPTSDGGLGPSRIHTVLSTSGSSGRPRLVALTAANHAASARGAISRLGLGSQDRWLASLSLAHVGGLAMALRAAVAGSTLVLRGRFDAERWSRELETARITHVSLVPTMLRRLLEVGGDRPAPSRLACALLGGAATDPALLDLALERSWPVALTYGLTEAASQVATAEPERVRRKPGTVGPPLPGTELRIENDEIRVRGPTVMAGYWDGPADAPEDGWLRTGDLGRLDEEGDLWILGRRSARIVTGGVNVDPSEGEALLLTHPGVRAAVVLGVPDAEWGERVVAAVEPAEGVESSELTAALERLCRERLAPPKRPKAFRVIDPVPRTSTGKPDRQAVLQLIRKLERAREHARRGEWGEAFRSLSLADRAGALGVDDLESLALAAYMVGRDAEYLDALERAHRACLEADADLRAARFAFWIGLRLLLRGDAGPATGWLRRARRLVDAAEGPCVEEGYLLLPDAERELGSGEHAAAEATAARAAEIGERFADADLMAAARHVQGRALISRGAVEEGLALLDEAMVAVVADEVSPLFTGLIYCSVIEACRRVWAFRRAREWTAALADWCDRQPQMVAFTSTCLVHRAEVMRWLGEWQGAIEEARRARELFVQGIERRPPSAAYYEQAEVHRLRGEFEAAERAYRDASEWGHDPQPGLSLLRLSQGRVDTALAGLERALEATSDPPARARLLSAYVEISLATGEIDGAREAVRELEEIADRFDTEVLGAMAAGVRGALQMEQGDAAIALESLRRAREMWERVEAPYRIARVRELVGRACRAVGDDDGARLELDAARAEYERLGAAPDLARLETFAGESPPQATHPLTPRQLQVLRLVAAGKTNKKIAAELGLSERTIERHVSNILRRLHVSSRVAATAYAYEHELIPRG